MLDTVTPKYSHLVPPDMQDELFWKDGLAPEDDRLWVPSGPGRWSRPLCLNVSQGYWVHITKVTQAGIVSRHRHPAPVHGFVLEGRWRYLERDWVATAGSYLYEPPGDVHTLVVDEGDHMLTLFHNSGALLYCDEEGKTTGTTDVFDRVRVAREHFESVSRSRHGLRQAVYSLTYAFVLRRWLVSDEVTPQVVGRVTLVAGDGAPECPPQPLMPN